MHEYDILFLARFVLLDLFFLFLMSSLSCSAGERFSRSCITISEGCITITKGYITDTKGRVRFFPPGDLCV